jgi:hypothetical protein
MSDKSIAEYRAEGHEKGKQAAKDLSSALNSMTFEKEVVKGFVEGMTVQHRTLQQCSMKAIYAVIVEFAEMNDRGAFDLRNQDTVKFCKKVVEQNKDAHFFFI